MVQAKIQVRARKRPVDLDNKAARVGEQIVKVMLPIGITHLSRRWVPVTVRLKRLYR